MKRRAPQHGASPFRRRHKLEKLSLRIDEQTADAMRAHARACLPGEAVGLVGARDGVVVDYVPYLNSEQDPHRFQLAFPEKTWPLPDGDVGLFHSHPTGSPSPSATDVEETLQSDFWRGRVQVIYAVAVDEFASYRIT